MDVVKIHHSRALLSWKCHGEWTASNYNSQNAFIKEVNVICIDVNRKRQSADLVAATETKAEDFTRYSKRKIALKTA